MSRIGESLGKTSNFAKYGIGFQRVTRQILQKLDDGRADDDSVRFPFQVVNLVGGTDAEANCEWKSCLSSK